ncbi:hypothetical protein CF15_00265 [Pyrodictium occultum]|uniref:Probable inosine/xanthosine triphosphatase n=1 Tax=Pyrodictium occultum TaxID=2309 RepID=A0A0V8RTD9_PYROC|nr:inosine/xanthosine triphosphatase [Pyrodictium occultum]KSW11342.1 hypothetical protein CF15_00265 [Pyrodictium occultum]
MVGQGACLVAVGSSNPVKVNAVRRAIRLLCLADVHGVEVESGIPSQPLGLREIVLGAVNRAVNALRKLNADYGVGVEAGVIETTIEPLELQAAAIVDREERVTIGLSQAFPVPRDWMSKLRERIELGDIASRITRRADIGERLGLIGYLTGGHVTRTDLTYNAVVMALVPRLNPSLYTQAPRVREVLVKLEKGGQSL